MEYLKVRSWDVTRPETAGVRNLKIAQDVHDSIMHNDSRKAGDIW